MSTKTEIYIHGITFLVAYCGVGDLWDITLYWSSHRQRIHKLVQRILNACCFIVVLLEIGILFSDDIMHDKRKIIIDNLIFILSHSIFCCYIIDVWYYEGQIRDLLQKLCRRLASFHSNSEIELKMLKCCKMYCYSFGGTVLVTVFGYGIQGAIQVISNGETFSQLPTVWPNRDDISLLASTARIVFFILWLILVLKTTTVYLLTLSIIICLRYQFRQLQNYFQSLDSIFSEDLSREEKEFKYEEGFKFGLKLHSETLSCVHSVQKTMGFVYSGQVFINLITITLVMIQILLMGRSIQNVVPLLTGLCMMLATGTFMWNAGDLTDESSQLPYAMYCSGWHNCTNLTAKKIRPLIVVGITLGQNVVQLTAFGFFPMTYNSYLSILKTSYSFFTVMS